VVKRRALAVLLAALPAWAAPPAEDLLVELRVLRSAPAAAGGVTLGTRGGTPPPPGSVTARTDRDDTEETQTVRVRNGTRATLHVPRLVALPTGDWVFGGRNPGVAQTRQWVDAGRGFSVTPTWAGGGAPVAVEVTAHGAAALSTSLTLPLDEWQGFASTGGAHWQLRVRRAER
jgi:hypothetical protein